MVLRLQGPRLLRPPGLDLAVKTAAMPLCPTSSLIGFGRWLFLQVELFPTLATPLPSPALPATYSFTCHDVLLVRGNKKGAPDRFTYRGA